MTGTQLGHPAAGMPSPALIFETLTAYQRTAALKAAINLDLFTAIAEGADTVATLIQRIGGSKRSVRILCDYLTITGFLERPDGHYRLTSDSAMFLDRRSPAYIGSMAGFLTLPQLMHTVEGLTSIVRDGLPDRGTVETENPIWVEFARSMAPLMEMPARAIPGIIGADSGRPIEVLDIAAGHGIFGITVAQQNPNARITALDWPQVLEVARENAAKRGVSDRHRTIAGDAFKVDFGGPYDVVLLTNFLHHFNPEVNTDLLRKVRSAIKDDGVVATLEFVPNGDHLTPPEAAMFSMNMLAGTPEGDAYSFAEFDAMFRAAGFSRSEIHPLPSPESVIVSRV